MSRETADGHIRELYEKGVVFPTKKGPGMARTFIQLKDASAGNPKYDEQLGKAFFDLCGLIEGPMRKPLPDDMRLDFHMRIVPRWRSIENVPGLLPFEDTRAILKSHDIFALVPCGCKRGHTDRWCSVPTDSCIALGGTAKYNLDRGVGRQLTYEEALGILDNLDEYPTVHTTVNQREVNQLICNCHYCCCATARHSANSRFIAENNAEDCIGCGDCMEKCQYSAIVMKSNQGSEGEVAHVDSVACRGCGSCVVTCSASSLHMKLVRPPEHIPDNFSIY
jgi:ferredoxin